MHKLVCAFVVIDIRHEAQKIDLEFINYLGEIEVPFGIVFTKADKISRGKVEQHVAAYRKALLANNWEEMPQYFVTSSTEGTGREKLLEYIDEINQGIFNNTDYV